MIEGLLYVATHEGSMPSILAETPSHTTTTFLHSTMVRRRKREMEAGGQPADLDAADDDVFAVTLRRLVEGNKEL